MHTFTDLLKIKLIFNVKDYSSPIQEGKRGIIPTTLEDFCEKFTKVTPYGTAMEFHCADDAVICGRHLSTQVTSKMKGVVTSRSKTPNGTFSSFIKLKNFFQFNSDGWSLTWISINFDKYPYTILHRNYKIHCGCLIRKNCNLILYNILKI